MGRRRVIRAAYDTETTNIPDLVHGYKAFPSLYQVGIVKGDILRVTPENVRLKTELHIERHAEDVYAVFDGIIAKHPDETSVVLVHNLSFDVYSVAQYLNGKPCKVLAKTARKPIAISVLNESGEPVLTFLDTLGLYMKSLETLGNECGMSKAVGMWDYDLIRAPDTPLTDDELEYASRDIYTLIAYTAYFLRQNPDIKPETIADRVYTKTGVVREKRMVHIGGLKGKGSKNSVRQMWHLLNKSNRPKTDHELFTMHAATRGGFTFVSSKCASIVYHASGSKVIESYDATSQHPAQMCSHLVPQDFFEAEKGLLQAALECVETVSLDAMLRTWVSPFPAAFYACIEYENLRLKENSPFERWGIAPLASARVKIPHTLMYANEAQELFRDHIESLGYFDQIEDGQYAYGKVESCAKARLFVTELTAWEISQCYDYDKATALFGFASTTFRKPSDMSVLSVMRFYKAKNALKDFMARYIPGAENDAGALRGLYPESLVKSCESGEADSEELHAYYMLAKSDLNALFGIEAMNEAKRDYELDESEGIHIVGEDGIKNLPRSCKCFYQYGQRIVGWSRIAQICVIQLIAPYVESVVCGDTDSLKIVYDKSNADAIQKQLRRYAKAVDSGKRSALARVKKAYRGYVDQLAGIGHYVYDGNYKALCAAWNKCYITLMHDDRVRCTIAGVPATRRKGGYGSYNDFCEALMSGGMSFDEVASLVVGYNVTIDHNITKLNMRYHPTGWAHRFIGEITDYTGSKHKVDAPHVLALAPMSKTLGDTETSSENARNVELAKKNNPDVNTRPVWLRWDGDEPVIER